MISRLCGPHILTKACCGIALLVILVIAGAARAAAIENPSANVATANPVLSEHLVYNIMVGGLHVGDAMVSLDQNDAKYATQMRVVARGVAKFLKNFHAELKGEGAVAPSGVVPSVYARQWSTDDVGADMTMTFDTSTRTAETKERVFNPETGKTLTEDELPWGRSRDLKPVPANLRTNVFDPMAAFVSARGQIMAQAARSNGKTFRVPIYDGKRRYDIVGKSGPKRSSTINGVLRDVIPVTASLEPVFGFARRTTEEMQESEAKLLFTADARFIPVQITLTNDLLSGVMNLANDCKTNAAACADFGKDAS